MGAWFGLRAAALGLAVGCAGLLGGCGFTPLYAQQGVAPALSHIEVVAPKGRASYLLAQSLDDALGKDRDAAPAYRLDIKIVERTFSRGLTLNNIAERYENHLRVTYDLVELSTGKTLKSAVEPIEITYAATQQPYAGLAAEQDAEQRAVDQAAQRISLDLAAYFAGKAKP
ncbi:MAG: hypothetical protein JO303_09475 [Caulobacteraceae bacterium]|nr:hypothetical protein [Caulobacteraceae bacterium]